MDASGLFAISKVLDSEIKVYWPTIFEKDKQCKYMSYCYNKEADTRYKLSILWASTKSPKSKQFQKSTFKANHFYLLANENFAIDRTQRLHPFSTKSNANNDIIELSDSASGESNDDISEKVDVRSKKGETEEVKIMEVKQVRKFKEDAEIEEVKEVEKVMEVKEVVEEVMEVKEVEKEVIEVKESGEEVIEDKGDREVEKDEDFVEDNENSDVEYDFAKKHAIRFLEYDQLLNAVEKAKPTDILPDMKKHVGENKSGKLFIVDFTRNRTNHFKPKGTFTWSDFEGQWVGSHLDWQVFLPEGEDGALKLVKEMTYKNKQIRFRKKHGGQVVAPARVAEALVMARHSASHGVNPNYKRKISAFLKVPSYVNPVVLNRCVYEYFGKHPGFKPHGNSKAAKEPGKAESYIRSDPVTDDKMKERAPQMTPMRNYHVTMAAGAGGDTLSLPRNPKQAENIKTIQKQKDANYKPSGNLADQAERLWNTCIEGNTFIRRVAVDCGIGIPEIYIR